PFEALKKVFTGSGECAEINWSFLGLSMPAWALVWFVILGGLAVFANWTRVSRY
ncbi:MAG: disulfide bond formation protein B, partial [Gammaproteobacteria bacterium]